MATAITTKPPRAGGHQLTEKFNDRLNCRINPAVKKKAEHAAQLLGQSITAFTEDALAEKAQSVLDPENRLVLSERDFDGFVERVNNPNLASPALKKAAERFKAVSQKHPEANW